MKRIHSSFSSQEYEDLKQKVRAGLNVQTHSGMVKPGEVFVAVPGPTVNGADYIPQALDNGAEYIITLDHNALSLNGKAEKAKIIEHPAPSEAIGELAAAHFGTEELPFPIIGVTGTNGKTTITYVLEHLFQANGVKTGVLGTINYRWPGVEEESALTTPGCWKLHEMFSQMAKAGVEVAIMEVSSHALHQNRVAGLQFQCAVMTNLTQDHMDYHESFEEYYQSKAKLFLDAKPLSKLGVINADDKYGRNLLERHKPSLPFTLDPNTACSEDDTLIGEILDSSITGLKLKMRFQGQTWELDSPLVGDFNASNLLAAQAVALGMGLTPEQMAPLSNFNGVPGRLERVPNDKGLNIFVDYAHTPDALINVLQTVKKLNFRKLITVFGCGGDRDRGKRPLMGEAVCMFSDIAVLTSDNPRTEDPLQIMSDARSGLKDCKQVLETPDRRMAIAIALDEMSQQDILIVAGKGHESYQQIGDKKHPFSDQVVIKEYLA